MSRYDEALTIVECIKIDTQADMLDDDDAEHYALRIILLFPEFKEEEEIEVNNEG